MSASVSRASRVDGSAQWRSAHGFTPQDHIDSSAAHRDARTARVAHAVGRLAFDLCPVLSLRPSRQQVSDAKLVDKKPMIVDHPAPAVFADHVNTPLVPPPARVDTPLFPPSAPAATAAPANSAEMAEQGSLETLLKKFAEGHEFEGWPPSTWSCRGCSSICTSQETLLSTPPGEVTKKGKIRQCSPFSFHDRDDVS